MGLKGRLTGEAEVSSHGHHVHEFFTKKTNEIATITPANVQASELHGGEFGKPGSVIYWKYTLDGKACVAKEIVEKVDEENKTTTFKVIEGDLLEEYNPFIFHLTATEKEAKWVLEYERIHEDVPHPTKMLDLVLNLNNHIDKHHLKP